LKRALQALTTTKMNDFDDRDHDRCVVDVVEFSVNRLELDCREGDPKSLSLEATSGKTKQTYMQLLELLVQKAGKIRMMVRFRNKPITDDKGTERAVKESYAIDGDNIMYVGAKDKKYIGYRLDSHENPHRTLHIRNEHSVNVIMKKQGGQNYPIRKTRVTEEMKVSFERVLFEDTQSQVYDTLRPFVLSADDGKPLGIFAYGGTGSGKTYTLLGSDDDPGILTRLLEEQTHRDDTSRIEVRIFETHPRSEGGTLTHRVVDLVALSKNEAVAVNADGAFITSDTGQVEYYGIKDGVMQRFAITVNKLKDDFTNLYGNVEVNTFDKAAFTAFTPDAIEGNTDSLSVAEENFRGLVGEVKGVLAYRRVEKTRGNNDGSSRSHLIVSIKVSTRSGVAKKMFIVDMAGKEHVVEHTGTKNDAWQTSEGINKSLDAFTRYLGHTKCTSPALSLTKTNAFEVHQALSKGNCVKNEEKMPHVNDPYIGDREKHTRRDGDYVEQHREVYKGIRYVDDPLFFLTRDIWNDKDSKIMLFACVYPLAKVWKTTQNRSEWIPKSWNNHFNEGLVGGEELEKKFTRDVGILREMDYIQKI
jgi:hypothetical protein